MNNIFLEGAVDVCKDGKSIRNITTPAVFGELAILYNCMRTATVKGRAALEVTVCLIYVSIIVLCLKKIFLEFFFHCKLSPDSMGGMPQTSFINSYVRFCCCPVVVVCFRLTDSNVNEIRKKEMKNMFFWSIIIGYDGSQ